MKAFEQLELQLWQTLQMAQDKPESAKVGALWFQMEEAIQGHEIKAQLEMSSEAILQMAGVLERRLQVLDESVAMRSGADPVMAADAFDRFVRQSMDVDFDQFIEPLERKEHEYPEVRELVSVVEEVSKEELLGLLEPESQLEPLLELELEHDEDVAAWAEALRGWMGTKKMESVKLKRVVEATGLPVTKAWMAGLLDLYLDRKSKEEKDFYSFDGVVLYTELVAWREVA